MAALVMMCVMLFTCQITSFAETASNDDLIIWQAITTDTRLNLSDNKYEVVTLEPFYSVTRNGGEVKAIMTTNETDDVYEVITIFPFKLTEEGELVNSFDYVSDQVTRDASYPITIVDATVTITACFEKVPTLTAGESGITITAPIALYRHRGVEAYWSSNVSNVNITKTTIQFISIGDLLYYEKYAGNSSNYEDAVYIHDYTVSSTIYTTTVTPGVVYQAYNVMDSQYVMHPADLVNHGGFIDITLELNNSSSINRNYRVY